jgi:protein-S-isoprenylcysteine O-methyltransferase Ste14
MKGGKLMATELFLPLLHIGMGLLLVLLGYLIKVKQWSGLISGFNTSSAEEKAKYDTTALCNGVGNFMYFLGTTMLIASLGFLLEAIWITAVGWGLFVAAVIIFLVYANTGGRYKKSE